MCDYCFTLGKCPPKWIKRVARSFQKLVISSDPTVRSDRSEVNRIQNDTTTAKVSMIVHKILAADERRKKNVVAVGIPETTDVDDREAFLQICEENLGVKPHIYAKNCVRIGKCSDTRPRPLLVKLNSEQTASDILCAARNLRKSDDAAIRQVYINPDLSPYAAKLAYEKHRKRRELKQQQVVNANEVLRTVESDATRDEQVDEPADGDTECSSNEGITDRHDDTMTVRRHHHHRLLLEKRNHRRRLELAVARTRAQAVNHHLTRLNRLFWLSEAVEVCIN